ncbi:phage portal protein [Arthrobacter sp. HY1533]|uniref:phage portal protein n=1 Tax=Arthrobacter sp. HY1533 TaxID=2970919 RepID=UPI0022B9F7E7|nr:phage portal protein [Arthrobacter sp. HY1533]
MFLSNGTITPAPGGSLADLSPMFANASYYGGSHLQLENTFASYGALYKAQLWVGVVVRKRAMATARMPFDVLKQGKGILKSAEDGALTALMQDPNPEMSGFDLWRWTSSTRDIFGESFWRKVRGPNNEVRELWPMHPANVIVRRNKDGQLEYVYAPGGQTAEAMKPLPAEDVVVFTAYNPDTVARGLSNLEALRMTLLNEDASRRATASFWRKGARPSMILTHPNSLSEPAQKRLKTQAEASMGGAENTGSVSLFEEGIVPHIMQLNMEEMQYVESRRLNREEVCAAYDISPLVVHILDHATFSNVTEQLRSQYRDTMAPWFTELEAAVNRQLVPDFYPRTGDTRVVTRFNMDDVLRGDYETRSTAATTMRQGGITTGNEARVIMGLEPIKDPNMDVVFANSALQLLGAPKPQLALPAAPAADPVPPGEQDTPAPVKQGIIPNPPKPNGRTSRRAAAAARTAGNDKEQ